MPFGRKKLSCSVDRKIYNCRWKESLRLWKKSWQGQVQGRKFQADINFTERTRSEIHLRRKEESEMRGVRFRKRLVHRYTLTKGPVFIILVNRKLRDTSVNWTHHRLCHSRSSQIYPGSRGNQRLQLSHCKQNKIKYLISNKNACRLIQL